MKDHNDSIMIALLPITTDWCKIELPHMTLVYAGKVEDHKKEDFNEMAKDASSLAALSHIIQTRVTGVERFGDPDEPVSVFTLLPTPELWAMRRAVEKWNASEHPFSPHVTIGPIGTPIENAPPALAFDRILFSWGEEILTFSLRR